jgi:hypothetical protein
MNKTIAPKLHRFRGDWMTVQQIAAITGKHVNLIYQRIRQGRALDVDRKPGVPPKSFDYRGEQLTIKQIQDRTGLSWHAVRARIVGDRFLEQSDIDDLPREPGAHERMIFHGGRLMNLSAWARELGITRSCLVNRLDAGWPIKAALTTPVQSRTRFVVMLRHDGKVMSLRKWAKELGCSRDHLFDRIFSRGEQVDRVLTTPRRPRRTATRTLPRGDLLNFRPAKGDRRGDTRETFRSLPDRKNEEAPTLPSPIEART